MLGRARVLPCPIEPVAQLADRFPSAAVSGFALPGLTGALAFYCLSLTPSLLPRVWSLQAVMSAVTAAIGYAVGLFIGWLLRSL